MKAREILPRLFLGEAFPDSQSKNKKDKNRLAFVSLFLPIKFQKTYVLSTLKYT